MSLKAFHVFFIVISIFLAIGFGFWCVQEWRFGGAPAVYAIEGGLSFLASFGLMFYLRNILNKLKDVSYL